MSRLENLRMTQVHNPFRKGCQLYLPIWGKPGDGNVARRPVQNDFQNSLDNGAGEYAVVQMGRRLCGALAAEDLGGRFVKARDDPCRPRLSDGEHANPL